MPFIALVYTGLHYLDLNNDLFWRRSPWMVPMQMKPNTSMVAVIDSIAHDALSDDCAWVDHLSSWLPITNFFPFTKAKVPTHTVKTYIVGRKTHISFCLFIVLSPMTLRRHFGTDLLTVLLFLTTTLTRFHFFFFFVVPLLFLRPSKRTYNWLSCRDRTIKGVTSRHLYKLLRTVIWNSQPALLNILRGHVLPEPQRFHVCHVKFAAAMEKHAVYSRWHALIEEWPITFERVPDHVCWICQRYAMHSSVTLVRERASYLSSRQCACQRLGVTARRIPNARQQIPICSIAVFLMRPIQRWDRLFFGFQIVF